MKDLSRSEDFYESLNKICDDFLPHIYDFAEKIVKISGITGDKAKETEGVIITRFSELVSVGRISAVEAKFRKNF